MNLQYNYVFIFQKPWKRVFSKQIQPAVWFHMNALLSTVRHKKMCICEADLAAVLMSKHRPDFKKCFSNQNIRWICPGLAQAAE